MKATIETKRLVLRNFQLSDAKSMFDSYCHSERITRYLTWYPFTLAIRIKHTLGI